MPAALAAIRRAVTQAVRSNRRAPAKTGGGRTSAGTSRNRRQANTASKRTSSSAGSSQKPTGGRPSAGIRRNRRQANTAGRRASSSAGGGQKPTGGRTSAGTSRKAAAGEYGRQASFFFSRQQSKTDRLANFSRHKAKSAAGERRLRAKNSQRQPKNDDGRLTLSKRQPLVKVGGRKTTCAG